MVVYTDEMLAELGNFVVLNYEDAQLYAEKHSIPVRSVIAKARVLQVPYRPKMGTREVEKKADIVQDIERILGVQFKGLDRLVLDDLKLMLSKVKEK